MSYSILNLPEAERPRERFLRHGAEAMSTSELIAILLGSGIKGMPVLQLAHQLLVEFGTLERLTEATVEELCLVKGLGPAKALQLKAAFCVGQRVARQVLEPRCRIENPLHAYNLMKDLMEMEKRELFAVILLDTKSCLICHQTVAIGTLSNSLVHPREVFYPAIRHKAASMILVHNHPSGDPTPSREDYEVTKNLIAGGRLVGIPVNDHIIIGHQIYVSLRQKGLNFNEL